MPGTSLVLLLIKVKHPRLRYQDQKQHEDTISWHFRFFVVDSEKIPNHLWLLSRQMWHPMDLVFRPSLPRNFGWTGGLEKFHLEEFHSTYDPKSYGMTFLKQHCQLELMGIRQFKLFFWVDVTLLSRWMFMNNINIIYKYTIYVYVL